VLGRALALADAEGLEALSIRRLTQDLGVTPMALYWHFKSKEDLLDAVADRVVEEVDLSIDRSLPWLEQVRALVDSLVAVLRRHRSACSLLSNRDVQGESSLAALEVVLDVLRRAGFSPEEATEVSRHALRTVYALVGGEPYAAPALGPDERDAVQRRYRLFFESLPPDRYPRLVEAARPFSSCDDPDAYYSFGVEMLLAGVRAMSERRAPSGDTTD
jgi:AcrR family transcriptional regulator